MEGYLIEIIDNLLRYKESPKKATIKLKKASHNNDLCPAFEKRFRMILDCFQKYQKVVYDIQGFNDKGTDIMLRFGKDDFQKYIAFQIKSYKDIEKKNYLEKLKLQFYDSKNHFENKMEQYYILLCTDALKHRNKIRQIKNEFSKTKEITVIDPTYILTFFKVNELKINAQIEGMLKDEDIVFERAKNLIGDLTPSEVAILITIIGKLIFGGKREINFKEIKEVHFIRSIYSYLPDIDRDLYFYDEEDEYLGNDLDEEDILDNDKIVGRSFEERFYEDLEYLNIDFITLDTRSESFKVELEYIQPIQSILLDAIVRYEYDLNDLLEYGFNALGVLKRFDLEDIFEIEKENLWEIL